MRMSWEQAGRQVVEELSAAGVMVPGTGKVFPAAVGQMARGAAERIRELEAEVAAEKERHAEFVEGLTRSLQRRGVPAMPSWEGALDYLQRHPEGITP